MVFYPLSTKGPLVLPRGLQSTGNVIPQGSVSGSDESSLLAWESIPGDRKRVVLLNMSKSSAPGGAADKKMVEQEHEVTSEGRKRYQICGMRFETTANYAVKKAVGQGAYGLVCSGRNVETGKAVAIKKIPKAFEDIIDCKRLLREIKILRHFKHENVLGLVDIIPPTTGLHDWKDVVST